MEQKMGVGKTREIPLAQDQRSKKQNYVFKKEVASHNNSCTSQTNSLDKAALKIEGSLITSEFSGDSKDLDEKIQSLMCHGGKQILYCGKKWTSYVCKILWK